MKRRSFFGVVAGGVCAALGGKVGNCQGMLDGSPPLPEERFFVISNSNDTKWLGWEVQYVGVVTQGTRYAIVDHMPPEGRWVNLSSKMMTMNEAREVLAIILRNRCLRTLSLNGCNLGETLS